VNKENLVFKLLEMLISNESKNDDVLDQSFKAGDKVLVRAHQNGVQVGTVKSHVVGGKLVFKESRKLWRWAAKKGIALESLAELGVDETRTRSTAIKNNIAINDSDCIGIMTISDERYKEIMSLEVSEQS
jgi:translation initiation factor 6 (eIF-6)